MSITGEADGRPGGGSAKGRRADPRSDDGHVRRRSRCSRRSRSREATGKRRLYRSRHARRAGGDARQPGDELSADRAHAAAARQRPSRTSCRSRCSNAATATSCWRSATTVNTPRCARCSAVPSSRDERFAKQRRARAASRRTDAHCSAEIFVEWSARRLLAALEAGGVPCGPINSIPEVFAGPADRSIAECAIEICTIRSPAR